MRFYVSLLFTGLLFHCANSQSFQIINNRTHTTVNAADVFYAGSTASAETDLYYTIKNTSGSTQTLSLRKYEDQLNSVAPGDEAQAFFCTGTTCYVASVNSASFVLLPGDSTLLTAGLQEATVAGASDIRYKISNAAVSESIQFSIQYSGEQNVSVKNNVLFSEEVSNVYPNPASSKAFVSIHSQQPVDNLTLRIFDQAGQILQSKTLRIWPGETTLTIATEALAPGVYFISIQSGNASIIKKLVISPDSN